MQRFAIILLGMASLVASGVIVDRVGHLGFNGNDGVGIRSCLGGIGADGHCNTLTRDELLRQKFILDVLHQVYLPLQQQDLLFLDDRSQITNEDLYVRPLTQDMHIVLDKIRSNQMLGKQTICRISNDLHLKQILGLYRLFVNARDFDTFKRLVVHARQNINTELFVNALVLALGERNDTQMLIVPALYEILAQNYHNDDVIDQIARLDTGVSSLRPQLQDVIGMRRQQGLWNSRVQEQQGGLLGVLRSQLWTPWRELHQQMAWRKTIGGNVVQQGESQLDKLIVPLSGNGLLSHDVGLKAYVNILIDELIVNQDVIRNSNRNQRIGYGSSEHDINERGILGNRGQITRNINEGRRDGLDIDIEHDVYGNIRFGHVDNNNDESNIHNIYGYIRRGDSDDVQIVGRGLRNRFDLNNEHDLVRNIYLGGRNHQDSQNGINTVSANDARLLFVGRRRKNPNNVVNVRGRNSYNDDDVISGGRRVTNEGRQWYNQHIDDDENERLTNNERYINVNRRGMMWDQNKDDDDHLNWNKNRDWNVDSRDSRRHQQWDSDVYGNLHKGQHQGLGWDLGHGQGRNDFLNLVTRGGLGQRQSWDNDQDTKWNRGNLGQYNRDSLDKHLPTTSINDERLLHINRHKLNNVEEGRRVNNRQGDFDDDEDRWQTGNRVNEQTNWQRNSWAVNRQDNQNRRHNDNENNRDQNRGRDNTSGHRYRRSLVNQNQYQVRDNDNAISGTHLLHTLQQLVARLNVERIALGQPQLIDNTQNNIARGHVTLNRNDIRGVDVQTANKIEEIIQRIDHVLQQEIGDISITSYNQKVNEIGLLLAGQIQDIGLTQILSEILQQGTLYQQQHKGQIANVLENQGAQILLASIVKVIDNKVQQVYKQREEHISTVHGLTINHVNVDQLETCLEHAEIDVSNLLKHNIDQTKEIVGRVPRLNHKNFNIEVDVTSDRQQQVVVRNLLVPKVDGLGNVIPLNQRRQNLIVLDITSVELQSGHNHLTLRSNDITITARDTTPLTQIYQHVMHALNGNLNGNTQDLLVGQTNRLPHRLLLPRGRINGLPMQLITVITRIERSSGIFGLHRGNGLDTLFQDSLPLNYPLHCDINDIDQVVSMPNLIVKDVKIYHDDNIKLPLKHLY